MSNNNRTTESLHARRAIAEKATPGPWYADRNGNGVITQYTPLKERTFGYGCGNEFVCDLNDGEYHEYVDETEQSATASHIAANSPDVVMADIDEILRLRAEVKQLEKEVNWLIETQIVKSWNGKFVGALNKDESGYAVYPTKSEAVASWREAARKAVEKVK